ncbi:HNH endonuclease [Brevibacillus borstelensis]|uniref:HNH endonuclease n=1 Tax=Brevibacillus borstelensis TaxID=45462 RepID=UPI0020425DE5|nr:HNH endonuclease [Brevibacillus borstelensis]MCM3624350.1 HNH endonuclease [Brevibacillus borstelensis]
MGFLKELGTFAGKVTGKAIGGTVRVVGELTNSQTIKDIGNSAEKATAKTGMLLGKVASGTVDVGVGLFQKDDYKVKQGFSELGDAVVTTAKDVGHGIGYVYENGKNVVVGLKDGNNDQVKNGAKKLGMVAAVGVLAVGVVDIVDGVDGVAEAAEAPADVEVFDTINSDLEGTEHPETGVLYESKAIQLPDGQWIEGVFPGFNEVYSYDLPESMYLESDDVQFSYLNDQLAHDIANDPGLAANFTSEQVTQIQNGETPEGYVWHHAEEPGHMELVDEDEHANSAHTGGREIWGGGSAYR